MFGAELEDLEPEPDEEDDPTEDGEGRAPGRRACPSGGASGSGCGPEHRRTAIYGKPRASAERPR